MAAVSVPDGVTRFRRDPAAEQPRATTLELFFDLVFVFAVTQVSHLLLENLTFEGAGQALFALLVVWWAWNYTTWVTNELDPDSFVVRLVLIGVMLASLVMAIAIPDAFGDRALLFAGAYVDDPGRPPHVPRVRRGRARHARARPGRADPHLVRRLGGLLARRGVRGRRGAPHSG